MNFWVSFAAEVASATEAAQHSQASWLFSSREHRRHPAQRTRSPQAGMRPSTTRVSCPFSFTPARARVGGSLATASAEREERFRSWMGLSAISDSAQVRRRSTTRSPFGAGAALIGVSMGEKALVCSDHVDLDTLDVESQSHDAGRDHDD